MSDSLPALRLFLSTLSLRRATRRGVFGYLDNIISIHALLAESDQFCTKAENKRNGFLSTLSLRRATNGSKRQTYHRYEFLSTLSLRRATSTESMQDRPEEFLSTLSLRRATISSGRAETAKTSFLSTLSLRRATISCARSASKLADFYPRSPCGERRIMTITTCTASKFLSTLSLRRATRKGSRRCVLSIISIHALLAESDHRFRRRPVPRDNFYPRSPCGERQPGEHHANSQQ